MADGYDRLENEGGGGSFVIGLLTGTVLGAGLGILFAPKAGSELRTQISDQAGSIANTASEGYRRASETASQLADRGRDMYGKARDAVARGADEAQRYVREAKSAVTGSGPNGSASSSTPPGESVRGIAEDMRAGASPSSPLSPGMPGGTRRS